MNEHTGHFRQRASVLPTLCALGALATGCGGSAEKAQSEAAPPAAVGGKRPAAGAPALATTAGSGGAGRTARAPSGGANGAGAGAPRAGTSGRSAGGAGAAAHGGATAAAGAAGTRSTPAGSGGGPAPGAGTDMDMDTDESAELYSDQAVPRFDIELPPESRQALQNDPGTYVRANLRYGDVVVNDIGIRIKGEGSMRTLLQKAAFKLKFDEFVPDQAFLGLRRLTLNNMVEDPSFMAERLAYLVYRSAALPAPRCNSALVYVNGELYGLYANVEAEDKTFLRRWFASDDGNLYEEGQRDFVPGAETAFDLETNESVNDRSDLRNLIAVIDTARDESLLADWGAALDTRHFLRFTAAEAAVNQWDMYAYTLFYPNNFRIYHDPTTGKFVFLPWGMDMSMKPFPASGRPYIEIYGLARSYDRSDANITAGLLFRRCIANTDCRARYSDAVREVLRVYEETKLETVAARYYEQIKPHVLADPRKEYSEAEFEAGYRSVLSTIRGRAAAIRAELE